MASVAKVAISLLMLPLCTDSLNKAVLGQGAAAGDGAWPRLIPLRREAVPVVRDGKVVSHRTSYSGALSLGSPAQDFRVVFDTGSGHLVLPSSACKNQTCLEHHQYDISRSVTARAINVNGESCMLNEELCDLVTIGYGTGRVKGYFMRDQMCLGEDSQACIEVSAVMGNEMSDHPFRSFRFDGVLGLGLKKLSVAPEFNFLNRLIDVESITHYQFGVFLATSAQSADQSEIAMGGYNSRRVLTPLRWAPVAKVHLGHWQVKIKEVKIAGRTLDLCQDGSCHGIVDTGTSHLGIPRSNLDEFMTTLSVENNGGAASCTEVLAPEVELVLESFVLSLGPQHYMRPMPLEKGVNLTGNGISPTSSSPNSSNIDNRINESELAFTQAAVVAKQDGKSAKATSGTCTPRLMPVNFPEPLGPKLFILGEPVLHRYYTVFDWKAEAIGFGLSDTDQNRQYLHRLQGVEQGLAEEEVAFVQVVLTVRLQRKAMV